MIRSLVKQTKRLTNRKSLVLSPQVHHLRTNAMSNNIVTIEATAKQTSTIIFLHGLGDTGHGWADSIKHIKPSDTKCMCPTAQVMPVSLNGGFPMPSWFDLYSLDTDSRVDEEGVKKATTYVHQLIANEEKAGIPANRIVLGGFSQGGALALYAGLSYPKPLAGILAFSCWLPKHEEVVSAIKNKDIPILQCHGDADPIVQHRLGQLTATVLSKKLTKHQFKTYRGMAHSSCNEELSDAKNFITTCLSN
ncbi:acyl-protein thioesterase 2-like [Oppia nitens]|uniref:acyl-protein thioesterase 2-like n=1 Tax=Oppia nitens TaxID=1686743 RepID=UPI0023DC92BC|nr:acyl-protein thioesterase 2-like [Oppia nitens]